MRFVKQKRYLSFFQLIKNSTEEVKLYFGTFDENNFDLF